MGTWLHAQFSVASIILLYLQCFYPSLFPIFFLILPLSHSPSPSPILFYLSLILPLPPPHLPLQFFIFFCLSLSLPSSSLIFFKSPSPSLSFPSRIIFPFLPFYVPMTKRLKKI
jgi:hypothetical protein